MWNHLKFAARQLRRNKGFALMAVLTLALGIGANTAIFTIMNTIMLRPLPYPEPDRLVSVYRTSPQSTRWPHSVANFLDYRADNTVFEKMAAMIWQRCSLAEPGQPAESVRGLACTADYFSILGVSAALGRTFTADEDQPGRENVVVLSHDYWSRRFGADTNLIGKTIRLNGSQMRVIGVMPASFVVAQLWSPLDAWMPLAFSAETRQNRGDNYLSAMARLKPGITLAQADTALKLQAKRLEAAFPQNNSNTSVRVIHLQESIGDQSSRRMAWLMLCLSGFILMIACLNLANLQLARSLTRSRELAVRLALGAGRFRLMSQLLIESLLIAAIGGLAGVLISIWLSDLLGKHLDRWSPSGIPMPTDWRVLTFALLCATATGLLFGIGPAWIASRANMNTVLKSGGRGSTAGRFQHLLRHGLIVGEVAVALILLTGSTLFVAGLKTFVKHEPGWNAERLLVGSLPLSQKYSGDKMQTFLDLLEQRFASIPGVRQASISSSLPIWAFGSSRNFYLEGRPLPPLGQDPLITAECVTPSYFQTMEIRLKQGRYFTADDISGKPNVVIVNQSMTEKFWPGENPLGKKIGIGDRNNPEWMEIVGVVNDLKFPANLNRPDTLWQTYRPLSQEPRPYFALQLRTAGPPEAAASAVRQIVAEIDPDLPVNELESARRTIDRQLGHFHLAGQILVAFALLGLALSALGIYGVISFLVVQRTGEIGIRMALGAQTLQILNLILGKGLYLTLLGIGVGLFGAYGIQRMLVAAVPEIQTDNPLTFLGVTAALFVVALGAAALPAWRATKVEPTVSLRYE